MSEKREFPILNGKLLSDLDLNGHKLLGLTIPEGGGGGGGGGGGPSVEVVAPSPDGAGKAADAKAVYDALEGKRGKTDLAVYEKTVKLPDDCFPIIISSIPEEFYDRDFRLVFHAGEGGDTYTLELDAGVTAGTTYVEIAKFSSAGILMSNVGGVTYNGRVGEPGIWPRLISVIIPTSDKILTSTDGVSLLPRYPFVDAAIEDGVVTIAPYTNAKLVSDGMAFTVTVGGESDNMRDCVLRVECGETAPTITWPGSFHPRTDAETDFKCEAGVRNVYWISEYSEGEFCVAGWQETKGGNAS